MARDGYHYNITFTNGASYTGFVRNGRLEGDGTITYPNGATSQGTRKEGKLHGVGTHTYANGIIFSGAWQNGEREGPGATIFPSGEIFTAEWSTNRPLEGGVMHFLNSSEVIIEYSLFIDYYLQVDPHYSSCTWAEALMNIAVVNKDATTHARKKRPQTSIRKTLLGYFKNIF